MSYVALAAALQSTLQSIPAIQEIHDVEAKAFNAWPAATITAQAHQNSFSGTAMNRRQYAFTVRFYYPVYDEREEDAEHILRSIIDTTVASIETDVTLGGACEWATPTEARWSYAVKDNPCRVVELTVECVKNGLR